MKIYLFIYFYLFLSLSYSQTKIVFTAIDYSYNEVRATICEADGGNRVELGFNKTYLPVWFNDKILLNSDSFIWQCDTSGENLTKLFPGYRASVSNNKKIFAFYDREGIAIANNEGKIIKQIAVNVFEDVGITWSRLDDKVSFFNPEKNICYLFNLTNDSLEIFGDSIYHPLWNPVNNYVLYNRASPSGEFNILVEKRDSSGKRFTINKKGENAVVPIWSNKGDKIAYLSFKAAVENLPESDLYKCNLVIYDFDEGTSHIVSEEAVFTDRAFPQMCFDEKDEYIYFTVVNDSGLGSIARVNLTISVQEIISLDGSIDERFPFVKKFE